MSALTDRLVLAGRQCPKRLWLEVHRPELREEISDATRLADRRDVRAAARQLLDPQGLAQRPGAPDDEQAVAETMRLLRDGVPVLDAVIEADGVRATVDAMLPEGGQWRIVAISSGTQVLQHHLEALALRTYLVAQTGLPLGNVSSSIPTAAGPGKAAPAANCSQSRM